MPGRGICLIACICLTACNPSVDTIEVEFRAHYGAEPITCDHDTGIRMTDLRFFVHAPRMLLAAGGVEPIMIIDEESRWQQEPDLVLIDLEDGSGDCRNGTPDTNALVRGTLRAGDYRGLAFELGVPFERNHANPLLATAPLDDSTMHWHWRSGYKFLRAGFATDEDGFWMHVGSAGCRGTVQNVTGCQFPNRATVTLPDYRPGEVIIVDLARIAAAVDLNDGVASDCSSGPAEDSCREPFTTLGLNFDSGESVSNAIVFRAGE